MMQWVLAFYCLWVLRAVAGVDLEFPNPQKDFLQCGRRNTSFVCDPEFLLDIGDVDKLDQLAHEFQTSTTCLCSTCEIGISVGVFIRRSLTKEAVQMYQNGKGIAEMTRKRWHLGKCDDDIVIIFINELNITDYSMGAAVQEIFPRETAQLILRDCQIHFQTWRYYQGLESIMRSFNDVLVRVQKKKTKNKDTSLITGLSLGIGVLLLFLIISFFQLRRQQKRRKRGCSDIYKKVSTKNKYANEKIGEYQVEKMQTQLNSDDDDDDDNDDLTTDEENIIGTHIKFTQLKRQLSAVVEESNEETEVSKTETEDVPLNPFTRERSHQNHSKPTTEL